ncbi:hypothetical protein RF11_09096 [Thelohanellus kitauei]|uniref:Uncharacterized protein n=1 Tax=Thelohanellus kitauei TaxID=669202 RepID=A0A0C2MKW7_THEKT|nr:hypothetical protein RF11_09096 [Thelohanellus kitauei]
MGRFQLFVVELCIEDKVHMITCLYRFDISKTDASRLPKIAIIYFIEYIELHELLTTIRLVIQIKPTTGFERIRLLQHRHNLVEEFNQNIGNLEEILRLGKQPPRRVNCVY